MDFELPAEDDPRRVEVRSWLEANPRPSGRQLAEAGYVVPHWPPPWGRDADPIEQLIIDDELKRAGVSRPLNPIGIGWAGPTIVHAGSEEQKERYLFPMLAGEELWCQLFSEPGAGSDLAEPVDPSRPRRRRRTSSTARRSGRRWPTSRSSASSSLARTPTRRSTRACRTSSARWTSPASRCGRSST